MTQVLGEEPRVRAKARIADPPDVVDATRQQQASVLNLATARTTVLLMPETHPWCKITIAITSASVVYITASD